MGQLCVVYKAIVIWKKHVFKKRLKQKREVVMYVCQPVRKPIQLRDFFHFYKCISLFSWFVLGHILLWWDMLSLHSHAVRLYNKSKEFSIFPSIYPIHLAETNPVLVENAAVCTFQEDLASISMKKKNMLFTCYQTNPR